MNEQKEIRDAAYGKWEPEGRPHGEHGRHWREAQEERAVSSSTPQTWSPDHGGGVGSTGPSEPGREITKDEGIKPDELNSENDQGAS
jgi:hypothetical protein